MPRRWATSSVVSSGGSGCMWRCSHIDSINVDINMPPSQIELMLTVNPGLAGVVAFDTEIAEPDRAGGVLRYRGVDVRDLAGRGSFADVWGLGPGGGGWVWRAGGGCSPRGFPPGPSRPPSRTRSRCTPATSAWTCR